MRDEISGGQLIIACAAIFSIAILFIIGIIESKKEIKMKLDHEYRMQQLKCEVDSNNDNRNIPK